MKHSHSCQSMPVGPKSSDESQESQQDLLDISMESSRPQFLSKSSPSNSASSDEQKSLDLSTSSEKPLKSQLIDQEPKGAKSFNEWS